MERDNEEEPIKPEAIICFCIAKSVLMLPRELMNNIVVCKSSASIVYFNKKHYFL